MKFVYGFAACAAALLLAGLIIERISEMRDSARFPPPGRLVDIGGGRRLHMLCKDDVPKGNAPGPTVIVEQGAGSPSLLWWRIQHEVSRFAPICLYDRAGYLWSDPPAHAGGAFLLQDRAADLHALLHAGGLAGPFILVGHSWGGPLIRLYAATYREDVAGLVLVDGTPEPVIFRPSYDAYAAKLGLFVQAAGIAARFGLIRLATLFWRTPPDTMPPDVFAALKSQVARPRFFRAMAADPVALSAVPPAMRTETGFGQELGNIPVIVMTHDQPFPGPAAVLEDGWAQAQARIARQSSRGELRVASGCNHMIPFEAPNRVVAAIRSVVDQVRASRAPSPPMSAKLPHEGGLPKSTPPGGGIISER